MANEEENVVLFPYMAQGHLLPFLNLANLIQGRKPNLTVSLVSTPRNIQRLRAILSPDSCVRLHALPFSPSDHGLPSDAESTDSLPFNLITRLFLASQSLRPGFRDFIAGLSERHGRPPLCIISDAHFGWTVEVAKDLGVFHATFNTSGAYGTACYLSLCFHLPHLRTSSPELHLPGFPYDFRLHQSQLPDYLRADSSTDDFILHSQKQFSLAFTKSDALLCNTVEDLEVFGLQILRRITGAPQIWSIGPLQLVSVQGNRSETKLGLEGDSCVQWLDLHPPGSVIYVSFGSQDTISASQAAALAAGLESSGAPFLWAIRPPIGFDVGAGGGSMDKWLPEGFEVRTREKRQGLLASGWVPQLEILSHKSVGAFLSHCGWNSVLESLSRGVPIIGWPLSAEQFYNSKMVEEDLGVGVEIARGVKEEVESEKVGSVIRTVVDGEKGRRMKEKAVAFSEKIQAAISEDEERTGSSLKSLNNFIDTAIISRNRKGE